MIITQTVGNQSTTTLEGRTIDFLELEWYETTKRILHKKTVGGKEISLKFLNQNHKLTEGDILFDDLQTCIVVSVLACEAIVIKPLTMYEMAFACYEIGNKHLPLFFEHDELQVPYEAPLLKLLQVSGLNAQIEKRKLLHQLKTTVAGHSHGDGKSLFSRILQLTNSNE